MSNDMKLYLSIPLQLSITGFDCVCGQVYSQKACRNGLNFSLLNKELLEAMLSLCDFFHFFTKERFDTHIESWDSQSAVCTHMT